MRYLHFPLFLIVALAMSGCFGLGHVAVDVPSMTVIGSFNGSRKDSAVIHLVAPVFYGNANAFVDVIKGSGSSDSGTFWYTWRSVAVTEGRKFSVTFPAEDRYIGYLVVGILPLGPTKDDTQSRTIFIRMTGVGPVLRVDVQEPFPFA